LRDQNNDASEKNLADLDHALQRLRTSQAMFESKARVAIEAYTSSSHPDNISFHDWCIKNAPYFITAQQNTKALAAAFDDALKTCYGEDAVQLTDIRNSLALATDFTFLTPG
jgi:hypothetical protein